MSVSPKALLLALLAAFSLGACTVGEVPAGNGPDGGGGGGGDGGGGGGGGQSFTAMIAPLVTECTGCHGGGQPPNLTSFMALEATYKTKPGSANKLVTEAAAGADHHGTPYLSEAEKTTVANWIDSLP